MGLGPRTQRYRHWSLTISAPLHDTRLCMANFLDSTVPSATKTYKLNHGVRYIYVLLVSIVLARFHWIFGNRAALGSYFRRTESLLLLLFGRFPICFGR